jgi:hypothetical protein
MRPVKIFVKYTYMPSVSVLGHVSVSAYTKVIYEVTLFLGLLSLSNPSFSVSIK